MSCNSQSHKYAVSIKSAKARFEMLCSRCVNLLSKNTIILCYSIIVVLVLCYTRPPADPDLFARLAVGRLIARDGIYLFDPFAFTQRKEIFIDHEWFSSYVFYLLSLLDGDWAFALFSASMAAISIYLLFLACCEWNNHKVHFFSFLFATLQCTYLWGSVVRCQVFTYVMIPLVILAIARLQRQNKATTLAIMPLAMLVWANAHGGFVAGFGLLGLYALILLAQRDLRRFMVVLYCIAACFAATCVNPYGIKIFWGFVLGAVTMQRASIGEWQPLSPFVAGDLINYLYIAMLLAGIWMKRQSADLAAVVILLIAAIEGVLHQRLFAIAAMVGMTICQDFFEAFLAHVKQRISSAYLKLQSAGALVFVVFGSFSLCLGLLWCWNLPSFRLNYNQFPVNAFESLRESGLSGRLLVDFNRGSFAIWRLYPRFLVSLDGRYEEVYPESTLTQVSAALCPACEEFKASFNAVNPDYVVAEAGEHALKILEKLPHEWHAIYQDESFAILSKEAASLRRRDELKAISMWDPLF